MGFKLAPDATSLPPTSSNSRAYISLERVSVLTGTDIVLCQSTAIEGEAASLSEITSSETWKFIPAVASGRVHTIDRLGYPGTPGRIALVTQLLKTLA
jgi:ABC-type Fe3+-hydroxamate transport system substrate-binding protein